ncbi:MAG TPA: hypothetical protein QGH10_04845, partial [Armatimonadota bacterium]|nr:hypothetical protein [Armatimonadota bacterium]
MYSTDPSAAGSKYMGLPPLFDPKVGVTVVEALGTGDGHWAGAPVVQYDAKDGRFLLAYRIRQPRPIRGGESRIAASDDGITFTDIWAMQRDDLDSQSIEKCAAFRCLDGKLRHYISYVDSETNKWRVDFLEGDGVEDLDPASRTRVLTADDIGAEGVKDPYVVCIGGVYHMLLSYAPIPRQATDDQLGTMHATGDIYNTGVTTSETGLATSVDGVNWEW